MGNSTRILILIFQAAFGVSRTGKEFTRRGRTKGWAGKGFVDAGLSCLGEPLFDRTSQTLASHWPLAEARVGGVQVRLCLYRYYYKY